MSDTLGLNLNDCKRARLAYCILVLTDISQIMNEEDPDTILTLFF